MKDVPAPKATYRPQLQARLEALAARQDGVVHLDQLRALGLAPRTVRHRVKAGHLHRLHRGVYAIGRPDVPARGRFRAAVLAIDGSVLSHRSAAALWGFTPATEDPVDVIVVGKARSRAGIRVHQTSRLPARDVQRRAEIPLTDPHRTILDLAEVLPRRELRRALGQAEVMRLVAHPRLREQLAHAHGRHGAPTLAALLDRGPAPTRSPLEDDLVDFLDQHDLGPRRHNARVASYEVDAFFEESRLVIEADSRTYHDTPTARAADAAKDRALRAAGCRVIRLRKADYNDRTAFTIRSILLRSRTGSARPEPPA